MARLFWLLQTEGVQQYFGPRVGEDLAVLANFSDAMSGIQEKFAIRTTLFFPLWYGVPKVELPSLNFADEGGSTSLNAMAI